MRTFRRSTTTSSECFSAFFSGGRLSASTTAPSMRKRTNPWVCMSSKNSTNSPLRSRTTGASTITLASSGRASVASTICDTLWDCSGRLCSGQ